MTPDSTPPSAPLCSKLLSPTRPSYIPRSPLPCSDPLLPCSTLLHVFFYPAQVSTTPLSSAPTLFYSSSTLLYSTPVYSVSLWYIYHTLLDPAMIYTSTLLYLAPLYSTSEFDDRRTAVGTPS
eukprot:8813664-Pyramimonas_sp.AAC.1